MGSNFFSFICHRKRLVDKIHKVTSSFNNIDDQTSTSSFLNLLEMPSVCQGEAEVPSPFPPDDDFMLAVGIQESLKTSRPQDIVCLQDLLRKINQRVLNSLKQTLKHHSQLQMLFQD